MKCCGIETYKEFLEAAMWNRTLEYSSHGRTFVFEQRVPATCCKKTGSFSPSKLIDTNCTLTPNSRNSNIDTVSAVTSEAGLENWY